MKTKTGIELKLLSGVDVATLAEEKERLIKEFNENYIKKIVIEDLMRNSGGEKILTKLKNQLKSDVDGRQHV